jgi:hypothetical protein
MPRTLLQIHAPYLLAVTAVAHVLLIHAVKEPVLEARQFTRDRGKRQELLLAPLLFFDHLPRRAHPQAHAHTHERTNAQIANARTHERTYKRPHERTNRTHAVG